MTSPHAIPLPDTDLAIVGGGLAGSLIALALAERRPGLRVKLIEAGPSLGGNHVWSFFESDIAPAERPLVEPLICHRWPDYEVRFPGFTRTIASPYRSIESERLDTVVRERLAAEDIVTGRSVATLTPTAVTFTDGDTLLAGGVIDARGAGYSALLDLGWQKFVGQELVTTTPHGVTRPVVMDATVDQAEGYRFVYLLPFGPDRLFVEDTYYNVDDALDVAGVTARIADYARAAGWTIASIGRTETGVLPVTMGGDFERYWQGDAPGVAKAGVRAGLFQPTTGYSLPDAVRTAGRVAGLKDFSGAALHRVLHDHAAAEWQARGFYRLLDRMLFRAAAPAERYRVLARFYRLDAGLIERFYAARSTLADKARVLVGKPPVPFFKALHQIKEIKR